MIERTPADDERRFADIMSSFGYFSRERGDPLIDDIFSEILNAETTLNTQTEALDADNMRELTELLNSLFVNRGLANTDMLLAGRLRPSSPRFLTWGTMSNGLCLTANILESRSQGGGCSLSAILIPDAPEKYFLSSAQVEKLLYKSSEARKAPVSTTQTE